MKILEIIPQLGSGGAERFTVDLCNELVAQGHDVTLLVLLSLDKGNFYLQELNDKVTIASLNKDLGFSFKAIKDVYRFIKEMRPDVVHSHLRAINYCLLAPFMTPGIKYFHTVHSDAAKEAWDKSSSLIRKLLFKTKRFTPVTISKESQRSFHDYYGMDAPLILNGRNIPQNINVSETVKEEFKTFKITEKTKVLMNLAHIDNVKRQDLLARCVDRLIKNGYDISLILVGKKARKHICAKIEQLGNKRIHILGTRNNPLEYLKMADAYCLSSQYEGLPISLIETLGVGTIPICTPVGGIIDIIKNGDNGFVSSDLSEESYYNSLKQFLNADENQICEIVHKTKETYLPFTMTECAKKYLVLFNK